MKKLTMICMAALLMIAASCKKDKKDEIENAGSGFRATVESHEGTGKTHLDDKAVKWNIGDAILVKSSTCTTPRGFTTQESGATVNFDADASLPTSFYAPPYTGYYPADKFSGDQLTLPATQQYDENNTFANGANPMAATSDETVLPFKNICGVLKLQLYSTADCQVRSIRITSNTGQQLWGTGTVGFDTDNNPTLGTLTGGGSSLTLDMGEDGKLMSKEIDNPTNYYFVVPEGTLGESFTVMVTETGGKVWTKTANTTANLIARNQITAMPKLPVTTHTPVSPSTVTMTTCVGCTFSVGGAVTVPSGNHTCEFGLVYSETDNTPTIEAGAQKIVAGSATFSGSKTFTADITGLTAGITYYVRAYAMIEGVTYSTEVKTVTVGDVPQPLPVRWIELGGKNPHPFTVASGKQVYFSQGNLQYNATGSSASAASGANVGGTWRFAEHQFDFIGADNKNVAQTYGGWIDLFGWGTSGYNHGAVCYQPWSTSRTPSHYYAYSTSSYTYHLYNQSGMADWGKANAISNGGSNSWRTLTKDEWIYLINSRTNAANLYGEGMVGPCSQGLIILPDGWVLPPDLTFTPDMDNGYETNVYTYSQWAKMEAAGAVFLPAAGYRDGTWVYDSKGYGYYWASSRVGEKLAFSHYFRSGYVNPDGGSFYNLGFSVRLVSNKN